MPAHRMRAFLKIEEGCNNFCSYCIIPYARGPVRSKPYEDTIQAVKTLVRQKCPEIVLSGIHVGAYGKDLGEEITLAGLIKDLLEIPDLQQLRIGSIEPEEVTTELLELMAKDSRLCCHLHIPMQAGSDPILKAMKRRYGTQNYKELIEKIRSYLPDIAITTDNILGFPGETEEMFLNGLTFAKDIAFADMHLFPYSPRSGTPAAAFANQIDSKIKNKRMQQWESLRKEMSLKYQEKFINKRMPVLVEQKVRYKDREYWSGHTSNYLNVIFPCREDSAQKGCFVTVELKEILDDFILGEIKND